jgi:hypothetical protein
MSTGLHIYLCRFILILFATFNCLLHYCKNSEISVVLCRVVQETTSTNLDLSNILHEKIILVLRKFHICGSI